MSNSSTEVVSNISPSSRLVTLLFCVLLGVFGVHRFYVGKIGTGILMLVTIGGLGIWYLVDLILVLAGSFRDSNGRRVYRWLEPAEPI
jgi:TM2 domain-containing membrane protein YozV